MSSIISLPANLEKQPSAHVYYQKDSDVYKGAYLRERYESYPLNIDIPMKVTLDIQIAKEIASLGYSILNIEEKTFKDNDVIFQIFSVELRDEIEDYSELLQKEKIVSRKLNLYNKNIILEIV